MTLKTLIRRPQDCSRALLKTFIDTVLAGGEMDAKYIQNAVVYSDALLFTGSGNVLMGVSALKYPRQSYLKHLYEAAEVPKMYNPHSIEACWLSVLPQYRGQGVWTNNKAAKIAYMANRPYHSVRRVDNSNLNNVDRETEYTQAGKTFVSYVSPDPLKLMVANHDDTYNPKKKFLYLEE